MSRKSPSFLKPEPEQNWKLKKEFFQMEIFHKKSASKKLVVLGSGERDLKDKFA